MIEKAPETKNFNEIKLSKLAFSLAQDDVVNKIEENQYYWDKVKYLKHKMLKKPEDLWGLIKAKRELMERRVLFDSDGKIQTSIDLGYYINSFLESKLHYLDFNFGAGLQKEQLLSELEKEQYLRNALMEESIFSSMIEGATTTRVKAKEMLRKNQKPRDKSEQMILNNYETIQYISDHKTNDISMDELFILHSLVTKNTLDESHVGTFRTNNEINVVNELTGEIVHTPPDYKELNALMQSFCDFFNESDPEDFIHPIVKASILHFLIGYIHPFVDGNGRTARAIFYWYLLKNGYWLTEYLSISRVIMKTKTQYEKAYLYTEIDEMDVTYFIHYQVKVLLKAFEDLKEYVAKKKKEESERLKFLQVENINERQAEILYKLEKKPNKSFRVKEVEITYGVTNQTARNDIESLVDKGYMKKVAVNKKSSNYWKGDQYDNLLT
jgi:Fic family protein